MIRFLKAKPMIVVVSILVFLSVMVAATYAYFQTEEDHGIIISTGEFEVEMFVYFDDQLVTLNSPYYDIEKGVVTVNAFDESSDNYVGNIQIYVSIKPTVAARYRFKIQQEWELGTYYINQNEENPIPPVIQTLYHEQTEYPYYPFSDLKFSDEFSDIHYDQQGYIYYDHVVEQNDHSQIFHIIDGGNAYAVRSNSVLYEECYLYFDMVFDIIQANRINELWGIDESFFLE